MGNTMIPDLSARTHKMQLEYSMKADAASIYHAWTCDFDLWFAQPGELIMVPEEDTVFFFYNRHDWGRHAHYGRFISLERNKSIEMTWLTADGTSGEETVINIELTPNDGGTLLKMVQSGFKNQADAKAHEDNWPLALKELDERLGG